jgi:hypothetical protein
MVIVLFLFSFLSSFISKTARTYAVPQLGQMTHTQVLEELRVENQLAHFASIIFLLPQEPSERLGYFTLKLPQVAFPGLVMHGGVENRFAAAVLTVTFIHNQVGLFLLRSLSALLRRGRAADAAPTRSTALRAQSARRNVAGR